MVKIECSEYSTRLVAPGHGFPTGAQIQLKGIPQLDGTFIVDHCSKLNSFWICRDMCVEVASIDPANSTVCTASPHGLSALSEGVRLSGFDPDSNSAFDGCAHVKSGGISDCSVRLESWCEERNTWVPANLPARLTRGTLSCKRCPVVLADCQGSGWASLVHQIPKPEEACLQEWQAAIKSARRLGKVRKELQPAQAVEPDTSLLNVGSCGWEPCHGIFRRDGHLRFTLGPGVISIVYVEQLGLWCMLAEVIPLHRLKEQRFFLGLEFESGPQLLYVASKLLGRWEPVIGPAPGPNVTEHRQVEVLLAAGQGALLQPCVNSLVLDFLFNYTHATWRGGIGDGSIWGMSAMEILLVVLKLWRHSQACSAVCKTWSQALRPFQDLTQMMYHGFHIRSQQVPTQLPSARELVAAIRYAAVFWKDGLMVTDHENFQGRSWPSLVKSVCVKSELRVGEDHFLRGPTSALLNQHAAVFSQVAQEMLHGVALPWRTRPHTRGMVTMGDGRRYASCDLLDFVSGETAFGSLVNICTDSEGHLELFSLDCSKLLPHAAGALGPLVLAGLRPETTTRLWSSSQLAAKKPGDPCGFFLCKSSSLCCECKDDRDGRTRLGASQLFGGYRLKFHLNDTQIELEINIQVLPFFVTSKDASLGEKLARLLPWRDEDSDIDGEDSMPDPTVRRRLVGKQPPPACYRS